MLVLSGIRREALAKLERKGSAVLELISFVNLRALSLLEEGDEVFLTEERHEELAPGTEGIVAVVVKKDISSVGVSMDHVDEREIQRARVKLNFVRHGRIKELAAIEEKIEADVFDFSHPIII